MRKLFILGMAFVAVLCSGCSGLSGIIKASAKDPAIVVARVGTPWGVQQLTRIGGTTNSVSIAPDGTVSINPK